MANFNNQQPNKSQAGANIQAAQGAQGNFGTEFASETNAAEVRAQNAKSAGATQGAQSYGTEFASETNAAEVKKQNQQSQANKNAGQGNFGQQ